MPAHTFNKQEKLKSKKIIASLFRGGQSITAYPLKLVWGSTEKKSTNYPIQFSLSVAKRKFPLATDRNLLRRRIRESYRQRKSVLYEQLPKHLSSDFAFMILYIGKSTMPYRDIDKSMRKILNRFVSASGGSASNKSS